MIEMITNDGIIFKVDDETYAKYGHYTWRVCKKNQGIKSSSYINGKREQYLATLILKDLGYDVDRNIRFIDGDRLNLQTENLTLTNLTNISTKDGIITATLPSGKTFTVDAKHEKMLLSRSWFVAAKKYIVSKVDGRSCYLHREVMGADFEESLSVDHINGDTSNNTTSNLRLCTHAENMRNRQKDKVGARTVNSRFKGLGLQKGGNWRVRVALFDVGTFSDEEAAANAYNHKAIELFGDFARLNEVEYMSPEEVEKFKI